jgi:ribosomal protein S18 acetylase RimI-like enzyme
MLYRGRLAALVDGSGGIGLLRTQDSGDPGSRVSGDGAVVEGLGVDEVEVRVGRADDAEYVRQSLVELMAGTEVAAHGELIDATALPALVAWIADERVGHLTYRTDPVTGWEVVTIGSTRPGRGSGGALLDAVLDRARRAGATRVWLITTNDNTGALRFYQRRGFDLVRLDRDAVTRARETVKPAIPTHQDGISMRHELELEWRPGDFV